MTGRDCVVRNVGYGETQHVSDPPIVRAEPQVSDITFEEFYRSNYTSVLRYVERRIDPDRAADVCAECFAVAWKKYADEQTRTLPWLYKTAHNLVGNAYRKRARQQKLLARLQSEARLDTPSDTGVELHHALASISANDREALLLTYWEGLNAREVGQVLGCSEQAAWKRISRAKKSLRTQLMDLGIPERKEEADV